MHIKDYRWTEKSADSTSYDYKMLLSVLSKTKNKVILDVGCGNGAIANKLILEGYQVYGVDSSNTGIEMANKIHPGHFFLLDVETDELPAELRDKDFDTVLSTQVIEHLYSPHEMIENVKRWFGSHEVGYLILTTPYHGYWKNLALALTGRMDAHFTVLWEGGHIKFFSKKTLSLLLQNSGFKVITFKGCGRIPGLWKSMLIEAELRKTNSG